MTTQDTETASGRRRLDRRRFLATSGATVAGIGLAGCQGTSPGDGGGNDTGTIVDGSDNQLGQDTLRLGVLAPEPETHLFGRSIVNSADLAATEINQAGGVLGAEIEILPRDTQWEPHTSRKEHRKLVLEEDVDMTIGPMFTSSLLQMMQSVAEQETLAFAAGSAGTDIPQIIGDHYERFKYVFRPTAVNLSLAVPPVVDFIINVGPELGWEKIAILTESQVVLDEFHDGYSDAIPEVFEVPYNERVSGVTNWTPIFDEIESNGVDLLLATLLFMGESQVEQWSSQERDFELGGLNLFGTAPDFYGALDGAPQYTWTGDYVVPGSGNTDRTDWYFDSLMDEYGEGATYAGPLAYDDVKIYAQAVEATGTTDEEELIDYLETELVYTESPMLPRVEIHGADGEYPHDPVYSTYQEMNCPIVTQWQQNDQQDGTGEQVTLFPDDQKTGEYKHPHWLE